MSDEQKVARDRARQRVVVLAGSVGGVVGFGAPDDAALSAAGCGVVCDDFSRADFM